MDTQRFDQLTMALSTGASRRKVLGGLIGGLLGAGVARSSVLAAKVTCTGDSLKPASNCQADAPGGGANSCLRSTGTCDAEGFCVYLRRYEDTKFCTDKTKNVCCGLGSRKAGTCQANAKACTG